ncbi:BTAD domain-containing putative transcriptional regulator [Massilia sp. CCM 9210]|uniref:AfsR/SARP family transcriptional regulator n=1 Tax=Massilia scottii TaxID=3057166 RepID=UPI002796BD49|nr:BTAD domain-containing putative transcriptional regulator [Massilia sp. CCM 9210]MDQ1812056.1 BTAD domain-containing putative transcriptional regulator [Massilia sp. CCM 9210]
MVALTVRLFGRFGIFCGDQANPALNNRAARELLCYLVLHRNHPQRRETLADLFWEDSPPEQARKYLRQALWRIQSALRPVADCGGVQALEVDPEWIQLNSCDQLQVDVAQFEEAMRCCHGIPGAQLDDIARRRLEDAVGLYRGDLLEGWYQDWCVVERERFQNELLDALEKLVCWCESRHDSERGLAHAKRMLALDPAREQVYRHMMQLHVLAGNRTQALREFQRCERVLMQELGVNPSQQTRALYESIRDGRAASPGPDSGVSWAPASASGSPLEPLPALDELLKRALHLFAGIETRFRQDIAAAAGRPIEPD